MSEKATTIVCFYAAAAFFITLNVGYFIVSGRTYQHSEQPALGFMVFFAGLAALSLTVATSLMIHSLWEGGFSGAITRAIAGVGSLANFFGKVFLGIWGVVLTVAVAYIYYLYVVGHAVFK